MEKLPAMDSREHWIAYRRASEEKLDRVKQLAKTMLGCFRTGDANDPEVYVTAVIAVLCRYELSIVEAVTSPTDGLPARLNWLPTVAEIRKACEEVHAQNSRLDEQHTRLIEQFRERDEYEREQRQRPRRLSVAELKAKYGDWDQRAADKLQVQSEARAKLIAQVGEEAFDSIPDAPPRSGR